MIDVRHHPLRLMSSLGQVQALTFDVLCQAVFRRTSILFFALATLSMVAVDPIGLQTTLGPVQILLVWPLAAAVYVASALLLQGSASVLGAWVPKLVVPLPIVGIGALYLSLCAIDLMVLGLTGRSGLIVTFPQVLLDYLYVQVLETLYFHFVFPVALSQVSSARPETSKDAPLPAPVDTPPQKPMVVLSGQSIAAQDVICVEAKAHFVRVVTTDEAIERRARMSDIVAQLSHLDGIQPHRSWWVGARAGPRLVQENGRASLHLENGQVVPIARGRVPAVRQWLAAQTPRQAAE